MQTPNLKTMDMHALEAFAETQGLPRFRGRQLFAWLYGKGATHFDEMTNLSKDLRLHLATEATLETITLHTQQTAKDQTIKCLFTLSSGRQIESVLIPDFERDGTPKRLTVCVSSQVGCAMACTFCATGQMGFHQNLTAGEIFDQVWQMNQIAYAQFGRKITNVVFMGMGEPFQNYEAVLASIRILTHPDGLGLSPKRITVSTVGLARRIKQFAKDDPGCYLAISLHAPDQAKRSAIMPVNRSARTDLPALKEAVQFYYATCKRRLTYEYCMFAGVNDTVADAKKLAAITRWAPSKVNLIMYNPVPELGFTRTAETQLNTFIQILVKQNVTVTVRRSRGQDIDAACGQLAVQAETSATA